MQYADALPESTEQRGPGAREQEAELDKVQQAVVAPRSWFAGRTVADVDFLRRYRVLVLGKQDDSQLRAALLGSGLARVVRVDRNVVVLRHTG